MSVTPKVYSVADATIASAEIRQRVEGLAVSAGFTPVPSESIAANVLAQFPGAILYSGVVTYRGTAQPALVFFANGGEFAAAVQLAHPAIGRRRKDAVEAIRHTFSIAPEDVDADDATLDSVNDLVFFLARKVRGEV